jgi:hypothetical protein
MPRVSKGAANRLLWVFVAVLVAVLVLVVGMRTQAAATADSGGVAAQSSHASGGATESADRPGRVQLLHERSAGFEGNFNNVFPPWTAGPQVGSWLRQSVEHYPYDPSNSLRLACSLGVLPSCSPFPDAYLYQTVVLSSSVVHTSTKLFVRGHVLVRAPESSMENQCCRNTGDDPSATADPNDTLYLQFQDSGGTPLQPGSGIVLATGSSTQSLWLDFEIDVTDIVSPAVYSGQSIRINFHTIQGDSDTDCTFFFLDALEFETYGPFIYYFPIVWGYGDPAAPR